MMNVINQCYGFLSFSYIGGWPKKKHDKMHMDVDESLYSLAGWLTDWLTHVISEILSLL